MHTCSTCGESATCAYNFGSGEQYACAYHDPMRPPFGGMVNLPWGFSYRTVGFPALASTSHLAAGTVTYGPVTFNTASGASAQFNLSAPAGG